METRLHIAIVRAGFSVGTVHGVQQHSECYDTATQVPAMSTNSAPTILSVSGNETLLRSRQMVLESVGWHVVTTNHTVEALLWLAEREFDAVVLGHSISPPERISLARSIKTIKPDVPVVMVCVQGDNVFKNEYADARVGSLDGPVVLINAIRRVTRRSGDEMPPDDTRVQVS